MEKWSSKWLDTVLTARAWTVGVKNDCKSMSVKLRYWIVKLI